MKYRHMRTATSFRKCPPAQIARRYLVLDEPTALVGQMMRQISTSQSRHDTNSLHTLRQWGPTFTTVGAHGLGGAPHW